MRSDTKLIKTSTGIAELRSLGVPVAALEKLSSADAFRSVGLDRRAALWEVKALAKAKPQPLFEFADAMDQGEDAVLTRLASADLLHEHGTIAPVVLDDAPVNTDPSRFKRMLLAIRKATKKLQIIILTCKEAQWLQEGAPLIRLADCRRADAIQRQGTLGIYSDMWRITTFDTCCRWECIPVACFCLQNKPDCQKNDMCPVVLFSI